MIVAIDGPAAAGKTSIARRLAEEIEHLYFDTGVMYRAVTLAVFEHGVSHQNEKRVIEIAEAIIIDVLPTLENPAQPYIVKLNGYDVTGQLRAARIDREVSVISAYPAVRTAMTTQQRRIAERGDVVMVGRDIGTVVLPHADLKLFMDASVDARAKRRWLECQRLGRDDKYEDILNSMKKRDKLDRLRTVAPLRPADDALVIDTTGVEEEEAYARVVELVKKVIDEG